VIERQIALNRATTLNGRRTVRLITYTVVFDGAFKGRYDVVRAIGLRPLLQYCLQFLAKRCRDPFLK
jgi:hypothetical protein